MRRATWLIPAILIGIGPAVGAVLGPMTPIPSQEPLTPVAGCCKVCRTGKACGDSCISRAYTCHKGKGCACNG